jgi:hypothetical protein
MQKKATTWITIVGLAIMVLYFFGYNPEVVFSTSTKIIIYPAEEWELVRTVDGNLLSVHKNHVKNYVNNYSVTEFQRGDAVRFVLNQKIFEKEIIQIGDTIGYVYSNEEQRRLIQLRGQLTVLQAELEFHTTGQKPEDVKFAERKLALAKQELETQRKLMDRTNSLIKDNVISKEQYDIDLNELKVKELSVELAQANLESIDTGEKPEMEKLIRSKIEALSNEIDQIQNRLDLLTVISPINGRVSVDHGTMLVSSMMLSTQTIIKIISVEKPIGLMPIRLNHRSAITKNATVKFKKSDIEGKVKSINNTAQLSLSAPYIFYVVEFNNDDSYTFGEIQDVVAYGSKVPFTRFLSYHMNN